MEITITIIIAVIVALSEIVKRQGLPKKYLPIVNIVLGVTFGYFYFEHDVKTKIFYGLVMGLVSSGLFDLSKIKNEKK
jgi:hypothetical protein